MDTTSGAVECTMSEEQLRPIVEALIYLAEEPLSVTAMVELLGKENEALVRKSVAELCERYASSGCGIEIREIADGYKMATKPEHHDWVQKYLKRQKPPVRLSLAALETLAVIAYKQPVTLPEIQEIRGVSAAAVMKTLVEKKLVTAGGRRNVVGRPILYKTTKDFLLQFGLKNLGELPSLEEYQEIAQASLEGRAEVTKGTAEPGDDGPPEAMPVFPAVAEEPADGMPPDGGQVPSESERELLSSVEEPDQSQPGRDSEP